MSRPPAHAGTAANLTEPAHCAACFTTQFSTILQSTWRIPKPEQPDVALHPFVLVLFCGYTIHPAAKVSEEVNRKLVMC